MVPALDRRRVRRARSAIGPEPGARFRSQRGARTLLPWQHADIADCFLVPQVYNAQRFDIDIAAYPNIARINGACAEPPAYIAAHPAQQGNSE